MKREDLIKQCRYYKGEKSNPYNRDIDENKFIFWATERDCCEFSRTDPDYLEPYIKEAQRMEEETPGIFNRQHSKNLSPVTKGLIIYIEYMVTKWNPWSDGSFIYDY